MSNLQARPVQKVLFWQYLGNRIGPYYLTQGTIETHPGICFVRVMPGGDIFACEVYTSYFMYFIVYWQYLRGTFGRIGRPLVTNFSASLIPQGL